MSIFHRAGTVLEFRAESLGEEGSGVRRVRALRGSPPPGKSATQLRRRPPPGARSRSRGSRLTASRVRRAPPARPRPPGGGVGRRRPRRRRRRRPSPAPRGSRIGDVTSARIVRGGLARIEPGRIPSRWARTVRGGVDRVALGSHYASPPRPRPRDSVERTRNYASPPRPAPFRGRGPAAPVRESGRPAGADAGRARAGPGPVRVSCTPSRA